MGRCLMFKLGIILISTPEGVRVTSQSDSVLSAVQFDPSALTYAYEWKLPTSQFSQQVVEEAKLLASPSSDFMQPTDLHCTSNISLGPDNNYERNSASVTTKPLVITPPRLITK